MTNEPVGARLEWAIDWIEKAPHGDNCYVSDNYDADPGNRCHCGKEALLSALRAPEPVGALTDIHRLATSADDAEEVLATIARLSQQPAAEPVTDPMDWPLPCDVTVGHGTMRKGVRLRTLVARMKVLYEMATGRNADVVANLSAAEREKAFRAFQDQLASGPAEPVAAKPAAASSADVEWIVDAFLADYSFEGDEGSHTPGENDVAVMKDAIMGLLAHEEFVAATSQPVAAKADGGETERVEQAEVMPEIERHAKRIHELMCQASLIRGGDWSFKGWTADGRAVTHKFAVGGYERTGPTVEKDRAAMAAPADPKTEP